MEVILLETMRNLGALGDRVKVKAGYARNGLIPQGKAVPANEVNIAKFEKRRAELEKAAAERHAKALERQASLEKIGAITIAAKAGEEGKLFGSIGIRDITAALNAAGADIEKRQVNLSEGTLRMTGEYEVTIELESDVVAKLKVNIVPQG